MDLFEKVSEDIKAAMKAKDRQRLDALRGIKKEFIEGKTAPGADGVLTDDAAMKILVKMAKQRRESAEIYKAQNREELAQEELAQAALREIIAETGASSAKEMGKVMGVASKKLAGRADGRAISAKVKELLA